MSRIIPFGKKSVTIEPHGVSDVAVRGHTFPLRAELRAQLDASWDSTARYWIARNTTLDCVERVVVSTIEWVFNDLAYRRSNAAKRAADTRRIRARRWNDAERADMQKNYDEWVDAGRPVSSRYEWLRPVLHSEETCPRCDAMLFKVQTRGKPLVCYECEARETS